MSVEMSAGDLLTTHKLKNADATSHLHIDQRNIPSVAQISIVGFNAKRWFALVQAVRKSGPMSTKTKLLYNIYFGNEKINVKNK